MPFRKRPLQSSLQRNHVHQADPRVFAERKISASVPGKTRRLRPLPPNNSHRPCVPAFSHNSRTTYLSILEPAGGCHASQGIVGGAMANTSGKRTSQSDLAVFEPAAKGDCARGVGMDVRRLALSGNRSSLRFRRSLEQNALQDHTRPTTPCSCCNRPFLICKQ